MKRIMTVLVIGAIFWAATESFAGEISKDSTFRSDTLTAPLPGWKVGIDSTNIKDTTSFFVIETRHKVFGNFRQVDTVRFGRQFELGEGEEVAVVMAFNPHLAISTKGTAIAFSDTLWNPAARVRVLDKSGKVIQEGWAFHYTDAPHYPRNHLFGFRLLAYKVDSQFIIPPVEKK